MSPMTDRLCVFDLDGVIYRGRTPLPDAAPAVAAARAQGWHTAFLTNNSARSRQFFADRFAGYGIPCDASEVATSASATADYLTGRQAAGRSALIVGEEGLAREMEQAGLVLVPPDADCRADYVIVGIDRGFTYGKLYAAQQAILHGARFIATNCDPTYPLEGGRVEPGGGSIVAAVQTASGTQPLVIGKPEPFALQGLLHRLGVTTARTVMVGDRLDTDIAFGKRLGLKTVLVLTGVTTAQESREAPPSLQPDRVLQTLAELPAALAEIIP